MGLQAPMQVYADLLAKRAAERRELLQADTVNIKGRKVDPHDGGSEDEDDEEDEAVTRGLASAEDRGAKRAAQLDEGFVADLLPKKRKHEAYQSAVRLYPMMRSRRVKINGVLVQHELTACLCWSCRRRIPPRALMPMTLWRSTSCRTTRCQMMAWTLPAVMAKKKRMMMRSHRLLMLAEVMTRKRARAVIPSSALTVVSEVVRKVVVGDRRVAVGVVDVARTLMGGMQAVVGQVAVAEAVRAARGAVQAGASWHRNHGLMYCMYCMGGAPLTMPIPS